MKLTPLFVLVASSLSMAQNPALPRLRLRALPAVLLLIAGFSGGATWSTENPIPTASPAERYAQMGKKSPFALTTVVAPTAAPQASFAANWFVSGIGRLGDKDFVTIKARDLSTQFSLFGQEPNPQGVVLASVAWSETVGKSTVLLRKGTETAMLEFNEAALRGPQPAAQASNSPTANPAARPAGQAPPANDLAAATNRRARMISNQR